jgi:hypothetical protein
VFTEQPTIEVPRTIAEARRKSQVHTGFTRTARIIPGRITPWEMK